jgi:predicted XRE-type DNA-binding protein
MTHKLFEDLGFSPQKAAVLKLKADLHTRIVKAASHYSQSELEKILQTSQPRISDLLRGKMSKFSLDMLEFARSSWAWRRASKPMFEPVEHPPEAQTLCSAGKE